MRPNTAEWQGRRAPSAMDSPRNGSRTSSTLGAVAILDRSSDGSGRGPAGWCRTRRVARERISTLGGSARSALVTGGTGFLGSRLVNELVKRGWRIRVLARTRLSANHMISDERIEFIQGDIADLAAIDRAVGGVDVVFHLAAEKSVQRCELEPSLAVATNVIGSWNVLKAASRARVQRIVAASTDKACEPTGILGLTKSLMERVLCDPHNALACTAVRLGGILESTGSVLDRWGRTQAEGVITVTDPEMTRFAL